MITPKLNSEAEGMVQTGVESSVSTDEVKSLGALLRRAREKKGLSCHGAAQQLFLTEDKIMGIDADDFSLLGAPIYARGYIVSYAKLVGVSETALAPFLKSQGFVQLQPASGVRAVKRPITRKTVVGRYKRHHGLSPAKKWWVVGAAIVLLPVAYWFFIGDDSHAQPTQSSAGIPLQVQAPIPQQPTA